jgi:PUA domain protein
MFKRFDPGESVSSFSQVKSSQGRAIRAKLAELYPAIEPLLDDLLPKKDPILVAKCQNHVTMVLKDREPLFFQVSASGEVWRARDHYSRRVSAPSLAPTAQIRDGPFYPTLRLVHSCPDVWPVWRTDKGAIPFVLGGANVMAPGFVNKGGEMPVDLPVGNPVVVLADGKEHAMAIGQVKMTRDDITSTKKGIAVEMMHFLNDGVWQTKRFD